MSEITLFCVGKEERWNRMIRKCEYTVLFSRSEGTDWTERIPLQMTQAAYTFYRCGETYVLSGREYVAEE